MKIHKCELILFLCCNHCYFIEEQEEEKAETYLNLYYATSSFVHFSQQRAKYKIDSNFQPL